MPTHHVPLQGERPDVEVFVFDAGRPGLDLWCAGELRMWTQHDDGAWTAQVQWQRPAAGSRQIGTFPADRVREDTVDRSSGR